VTAAAAHQERRDCSDCCQAARPACDCDIELYTVEEPRPSANPAYAMHKGVRRYAWKKRRGGPSWHRAHLAEAAQQGSRAEARGAAGVPAAEWERE
jgi:hypothetical protein